MNVKLIAYTTPVNLPNPEDLVAYCARVSNPANQDNPDSAKLLNYLKRNNHWSPFEMASATLEIQTTRDIARQILRHRSFSFQEFSQRYAVQTNFTTREARLQDTKNRQNSIPSEDKELNDLWEEKQKDYLRQSQDLYTWALTNGIAKEQARAVLPEGLTQSTLYMAGTLRSWLHYIELREANGTQLEHQEIAKQCRSTLQQVFPAIFTPSEK